MIHKIPTLKGLNTKPLVLEGNRKEYNFMPQSLVQDYKHIIFSTKKREPFLRDESIRAEMHAYLGGVCRNHQSPAIIVGGIEEHIHILCRMSKSISVESLLLNLKKDSSKWIKGKAEICHCRNFYWQGGYGAFSVSPSHVDGLTQYIAEQEEHHRKESFQDEFRRLCRKYGIPCDERYAWD